MKALANTFVDVLDIMQQCMNTQDFAALLVEIRNWTVQHSRAIRDEVFTLFFPNKPLVVLFHEERRDTGKRLEAYSERKKMSFISTVLATARRGNAFDFDVLAFKEPLVNGFIPQYLGGGGIEATLDETVKRAKTGFDLGSNHDNERWIASKISVVSVRDCEDLRAGKRLRPQHRHAGEVVHFVIASTSSVKALTQHKERPCVSIVAQHDRKSDREQVCKVPTETHSELEEENRYRFQECGSYQERTP